MSRRTMETRETRETVRELAERTVQRYARGLLSVEELEELLARDWHEELPEGEASTRLALEERARGLCIQVLYEACLLPAGRRREQAFELLSAYLARALDDLCGAGHEAREDIVQQAVCEILVSLRKPLGGLEQPRAFLGWARVILHRQFARYLHARQLHHDLSLEDQDEPWRAEYIDERAADPLDVVLSGELRAELEAAIAHLRNPRYRAVLHGLYFHERGVSELAAHLRVQPPEIRLWHHRAVYALHKQWTRGDRRKRG